MAILHPRLSLSTVAKYGTPTSRMAFCHLRCHLRWSMVFGGLGAILIVTDMPPLICNPVGVALKRKGHDLGLNGHKFMKNERQSL